LECGNMKLKMQADYAASQATGNAFLWIPWGIRQN
jgi:hypothetical protein